MYITYFSTVTRRANSNKVEPISTSFIDFMWKLSRMTEGCSGAWHRQTFVVVISIENCPLTQQPKGCTLLFHNYLRIISPSRSVLVPQNVGGEGFSSPNHWDWMESMTRTARKPASHLAISITPVHSRSNRWTAKKVSGSSRAPERPARRSSRMECSTRGSSWDTLYRWFFPAAVGGRELTENVGGWGGAWYNVNSKPWVMELW